MSDELGARVSGKGTFFAVRAPLAEGVWLCLFEEGDERRIAMTRSDDVWHCRLAGDLSGARYGYRAEGEWAPEHGRWFDPAKLLVDPYAFEIDRRFVYDSKLSDFGADTADIVPRAIVPGKLPRIRKRKPCFERGGLIYELNVKALTWLHPEVPEKLRGRVAALAHPAVIAHLKKLHVSAVELMPVVAWIDERHLPPLGLHNAWGYNPVAPMALDPGLCPGGVAELRETVAALHAEGIGTILDIVLNHTGESDIHGPVLSLRGLDDEAYAREPNGELANVTGCGNTLDFGNEAVRELALAALRHFVAHCGIDGFRFDLAPVLARGPEFDPHAPFFAEISADPLLADRVLIAEPWDIGPGGYRLGQFPANWLEWNDRYRDDVRRFWRGDGGAGTFATRIAGSADVFGKANCRSVSFLAAHDGFTLADTVSYSIRHNWANGEGNRDGHGGEVCWNNAHEGPSDDLQVLARRAADLRAMLGTLFASTGTIMLTAGDEFGRSHRGNNNAYCQDNELTWLDWDERDSALEEFVAGIAAARAATPKRWMSFPESGEWSSLDGSPMTVADWENSATQGFEFSANGERISIDRESRLARRQVSG